MFSGKSCNYTKLRTNLRLAINRLKLLEKKKTELALKARKEIADYISAGKEDRARIRVEHIVREDYMVEAMEIIEMFCDLLLARFGLIEKMKEMDPGLEEAIATILWASPYLSADIQEMKELQKQLGNKYSKEYVEMCHRNGFENVNEQVMHKMSIAAPPKILIENYMIEIAKTYKVAFEPDASIMAGEPAEAVDLISLESGSAGGGAIGFETYDNAVNEKKKPPTPPGPGGSDFPGFGGGSGGGGGSGMPLVQPTLPLDPHAAPGVQVMPPVPLDMDIYNSGNVVPPYQPPPGEGFPPNRGAPPIPSMPPNSGSTPDPHWPNEAPLPQYNDVIAPPAPPSTLSPSPLPSVPGVPSPSPGDEDPTESIMNLPEVPSFPNVPSNPAGATSVDSEDIDFDDLTRRFQDLKKRK